MSVSKAVGVWMVLPVSTFLVDSSASVHLDIKDDSAIKASDGNYDIRFIVLIKIQEQQQK